MIISRITQQPDNGRPFKRLGIAIVSGAALVAGSAAVAYSALGTFDRGSQSLSAPSTSASPQVPPEAVSGFVTATRDNHRRTLGPEPTAAPAEQTASLSLPTATDADVSFNQPGSLSERGENSAGAMPEFGGGPDIEVTPRPTTAPQTRATPQQLSPPRGAREPSATAEALERPVWSTGVYR